MSKPLFELDRIDADALRAAGQRIRKAGFTEAGVRARLGLKDVADVRLAAYPYYRRRSLRRRHAVDVAIDLWLLQGEVTHEELTQLVDVPGLKVLRQAGLLAGDRSSRTYRARVSIYPVGEDHLFVTDHRFQHTRWLQARVPTEPVMYLGGDTYVLTRCTPRRPIRSALDLCSGSGVHAVLAAGSADRSVGIDLNPRAVKFARLNAMLNGTWNSVFLEGDLYSPVGGERFDLILANPPFVPAPVYGLMYRDGGPSGADVIRRIVAGLPDRLNKGGVAQIVTHVAEREGERYLDRVRRWLGGANMHIHALRLGEEDVVDYAIAHTKRSFGERFDRFAPQVIEWITNLRAQRFRRMIGTVLTFVWNEESPLPPWTQEDEAKPPRRPIAPELERLLNAKHRARKLDPRDLDAVRVMVPDDVVLTERFRPAGGAFEPYEFRVNLRGSAISPELDVRQLIRDVLRQVDNRSTVPEIVARLAAARGLAASDINDRCRQALLTMFARGLVTFDMADLPAPGQEDALEGSVEGEDEPPSAGPGATIADVKPLDG